MEILILVLLYYLSQNPAFAESVKPLMSKIKDSEQMLHFLNDLSKFSGVFGGFAGGDTKQNEPPKPPQPPHGEKPYNDKDKGKDGGFENGESHSAPQDDKKNPQSPTKGIADEFIQNILESYLQKR